MTRRAKPPSLLFVACGLVGCVLATIWLVIVGLTMYLSFAGPRWILTLSLSIVVLLIGSIWIAFYRLSFIRDDIIESDPRVYVTIREPDETTAKRPFTLTNHGGGAAHNVQIETLTVCGRQIEFPQIAVVPVGDSRDILPRIVSKFPEVTTKNDLFYWMEQDWSTTRGNIMAEWPVSMAVVYDDYTGKRTIRTTTLLVFYPLHYKLRQQGTAASIENPIYEFRHVAFSLLNGRDEPED